MAIYGECIGAHSRAAVTISDLDDTGCDLFPDSGTPVLGDCALWIGAVGPFEATAIPRDNGHSAARFKEPLDRKIVHHFNCG
ncbi:hypothetical protein [Novosphingobium album (ex Liu et al. 2023)]|nr:hypothetical protein [Novosphingobium album (ex Liu et al. 2023)]